MSREIKFRVWSKETSHYYDVECLKADGSVVARYIANGKINYLALSAEEIVVEQYTGLEDKNGVEIYEGDIVKIKWNFYEIVFYEHNARFALRPMPKRDEIVFKDPPMAMMPYSKDNSGEVIGNIHENPGLLSPSNSTELEGKNA